MPQNSRPLLIGVTGNIGSGKSTFCNALENCGIKVYSADLLAQQKLDDSDVIALLVQHFGEAILSKNKPIEFPQHRINRRKLAALVFSDPDNLQFLNSVIHPLVLQDMDEIVRKSRENCLVFEVPLLFEAGLQNCFDYLILVHTSSALRNARIIARGGESEQKRSEYQISDAEKLSRVDLAINNDGSAEELKRLALSFAALIKDIAPQKVRPFYTV